MNEQIILLFLVLIITMLILWQSYRINDFNVEGLIFGVRVPEKYRRESRVISIIKNYNKRVLTLTAICFILFICAFYFIQKVYIIIVYSYLLAFINLYSCYLANKKLKIVKKNIGWEKKSENKVYVQIGKGNTSRNLNLMLFYVAVAIAVLGFLITISRLSSLPKMVPVHFGINGPDNWVDSTTFTGKLQVVMLPLVSMICVFSMFFSAKIQAKKDNTRFNGGTLSSLILKKSFLNKSMTQMLGIISIGVSLMILYGVLLVVGIMKFNDVSNFIFIVITIGVIFFPMTYLIYSTKKANQLKSDSISDEKEIYNDDDINYIGGIFYHNPNDPANIVPKRIGYGLDFNYAHILGKAALLILVAVLIGIIIIMAVFNI